MGTAVVWEGNIGSAPEFKEFPNGNKDPRRLCRLNVYFDNPVPKGDGYEDRGGFWANVEIWHANAEQYASLYQKGMRVVVQGRALMDTWGSPASRQHSGKWPTSWPSTRWSRPCGRNLCNRTSGHCCASPSGRPN